MKKFLLYSLVICLLVSCKKDVNNATIPNAGTVSGPSPLTVGQTGLYTSTGDVGGTWGTSNPLVATVNSTTGMVTAIGAGTVWINYTVSMFTSASANLTVNPAPCTLSMAAVAGNWRITAISYKQTPASPPQDYYNIVFTSPCEKDDTHQLLVTGVYNFIDAGIVCAPSGSYTSTWSLTGNIITIDGDPATVESFSCNSMTVSQTNLLVAGDKATFVLTRI